MNVGGLPSLLKEGTKHFSGVEESCLRNIEASKQLYHIVRTSLGPEGKQKNIKNDAPFQSLDTQSVLFSMKE